MAHVANRHARHLGGVSVVAIGLWVRDSRSARDEPERYGVFDARRQGCFGLTLRPAPHGDEGRSHGDDAGPENRCEDDEGAHPREMDDAGSAPIPGQGLHFGPQRPAPC
jgi:hypothetical protein